MPANVRKFNIVDDNGNTPEPGTKEYRNMFRRLGKYKDSTLRQMSSEWNRFISYLADTNKETYGPVITQQLLDKQLPDETICTMMSDFLENRIHLFAWYDTGKVVPLDLTTLERVWTQLSSMIYMELNVKVNNNSAFDGARQTKATLMRDAKANHQLGNLSN